MRQGQQHRRGRSRNGNGHGNHSHGHNNHRKGQNPLVRSFESNGPDVKVRGTPAHIAEKYISLARDAQTSGDPVLAENYLQHAEHYNRIILAYREQQGLSNNDPSNGGPPRLRTDGMEGEDGADGDSSSSDDFGHGDQPMVTRFPQEQRPSDNQPRADERRPQDQQQQHGRFRDRNDRHRQDQRGGDRQDRGGDRMEHRGERQDRGERDRFERHDRGERFDRGDRQDRGDRGERHDRGDRQGYGGRGHERTAYQGGSSERPERHQERAEGPIDGGSGEHRSPEHRSMEIRTPEARAADVRGHEPRNYEPRPARDRGLREDIAPPVADVAPAIIPPAVELPVAQAEPPVPATRRRERFAPADQPDFLRRPVRRPRKEAATDPAATAAEPQSPPDEPPRE